MSTIYQYTTLAAPAQAEFKDKGSRFLAFAYPVQDESEIRQYVQILREQHYKARHCCFAWRLGVDGNRYRANDDGEPAGSAGRPILGQIDSANITDVVVIVIRYFGGTLLGVPGLIHAYKSATAAAIEAADKICLDVCRQLWLYCDYAHLSEAMRWCRQQQAQIIQQDLQQQCCLSVRLPLAQLESGLSSLRKLRMIDVKLDN
ncbi:IMPACT family protein [Snodgrassella alvi]|uniref:IMPACT family protein n=1 Tax=Snodgrassella alvi TaxID=1196083 RepID=UPI000A01961E|nr:YigZ family protein [Snodgrassella alvi]ORF04455.1 YigZ family protein [Snodgrassella alvi]